MAEHVPGPRPCTVNIRIERELGWSPSTTLREGMRRTYEWIEGEVRRDLEGSREEPSVFAVSA